MTFFFPRHVTAAPFMDQRCRSFFPFLPSKVSRTRLAESQGKEKRWLFLSLAKSRLASTEHSCKARLFPQKYTCDMEL